MGIGGCVKNASCWQPPSDYTNLLQLKSKSTVVLRSDGGPCCSMTSSRPSAEPFPFALSPTPSGQQQQLSDLDDFGHLVNQLQLQAQQVSKHDDLGHNNLAPGPSTGTQQRPSTRPIADRRPTWDLTGFDDGGGGGGHQSVEIIRFTDQQHMHFYLPEQYVITSVRR
ncbi:hypothetical protein QTP88_019066 [Uroleucon formosanum]